MARGVQAFMRHPRNIVRWAVSMLRRSNSLDQRVPWIVYSARDRISSALSASSRVFEYGSGGSTLWFADQGCAVTSVEHDPVWCERVRAALNGRESRVTLLLILPSARDGGSTALSTGDPAQVSRSFREYASAIDRYQDGAFDLVLVDGRARADCLDRAWPKVRSGGLLVLDDSDRERYQESMNRLPHGVREDHRGLVAFSRRLGQTTIWRKP